MDDELTSTNKRKKLTNIVLTTVPFTVSIGLIIHNRLKNENAVYKATQDLNKNGTPYSEADKWVFFNNIDNHETWILFLCGFSLGRLTKYK